MNKIIIHYTSAIICCLVFSIITFPVYGQQPGNQHDLTVIRSKKLFIKSIAAAPDKEMTDLKTIPGIVIDLAYQKPDNFMHMRLYPAGNTTYLRQIAATALKKVQNELATQGLGIKVWDAYRPYSVTVKMWEPVKDERYVANPAKGSGHNRGIAVDITLIYLNSRQELPMGTGFDNFSDTAHVDFKSLPEKILENRHLLQSIMQRNGFVPLESEWWHFYVPAGNNYELLDLSFKQLSELSNR